MGWDGVEFFDSLWSHVRNYIPQNKREIVLALFINDFENEDCDTLHESMFYEVREAVHEMNKDDEYYEAPEEFAT